MVALRRIILASSVGFIFYIPDTYALTCASEISPTAACNNLVITTPSSSINVPLGVTITDITGPASLSLPDISASGITVTNSGNLTSTNNYGAKNRSLSTTIFNSGYIVGNDYGVVSAGLNRLATQDVNLSSIVNTGFISGSYAGIFSDWGVFRSLTNTGTIIGSTFGSVIVMQESALTTLNNLQGVGTSYIPIAGGSPVASGPLTYYGYLSNLPANYNIIINSTTNYGQLSVLSGNGSMAFGVYGGSVGFTPATYINSSGGTSSIAASIVTGHKYLNVLQGLVGTISGSGNSYSIVGLNFSVTGITGTYAGYNYSLVANEGISGNWDLVFALAGPSGPTAADTQASLHSLAPKLRSAFSSQTIATNFANMNTYDCNLFDAKGLCVSVGGQQTYLDSPSSNMSSAVVVAGYKVSPQIRIGGFLNQNVNSNTGSNVDISNKSPLMGLFAVWNQNENQLGYQLKIANAYQDKDVTTIRDAYGDTGEAGRGKTNLNTQSYVGELSYAFLTNEDKTLVRPYAAVRYTRIKQDGYTEDTSASVTTPLTYAALEDRSTSALVGIKLNHKLAEKVNLTGSIGVEQDLDHDVDNLTASGVSGLTSEAFNNIINRTRPVASIGAYYMPVKNQRIAADIYYQELPFQSTAATTAYVNYMIGF